MAQISNVRQASFQQFQQFPLRKVCRERSRDGDRRADRPGGFLATLTPEQWEAPSLCEGWRVRDVVAHVMSFDGVSLLGMFRRVIRGRIVHINQVGVDELASLSTEQLLDKLRAHLRPQGLATTFGGRLALLDVTIHHQDIRRPLGLPRQIPAERLRWSWTTACAALSCRRGTSPAVYT